MLRGCMYRLVDPVVFAAHCSTVVWLPLIHAALCCSVLEEHGPLGSCTENFQLPQLLTSCSRFHQQLLLFYLQGCYGVFI